MEGTHSSVANFARWTFGSVALCREYFGRRRCDAPVKKLGGNPNTLRQKLARASSQSAKLNQRGEVKEKYAPRRQPSMPKLKCLEEKIQ